MTKKMKNQAAVMLGQMGGKKKSEAKARAARENNKKNLRMIAERYFKECPELYNFEKDILEKIRAGERFIVVAGRKFGLATLASVIQPEQKTVVPIESKNQLRF